MGLGLVLLLLAVQGGERGSLLPYLVLLGALALSLVYGFVGRRFSSALTFARVQVIADGVLITALVYLTGGVYSFAALLYFGAVIAAALCVSRQLGLLMASGATVALAAVQVGYHLAAADPPVLSLPFVLPEILATHRLRLGQDSAYLIAQGLAYHAVALLGGYLARELEHVQVLYREILETMAEGLVVIDARHRFVFINREAKRLLGYTRSADLRGQDFRAVFRRRQDREILDCLLASEPASVELDVDTRGGRRAYHVKTTLLQNERGAVRATIGVFTDLTLLRQVEQAERRAVRFEELKTLALGIAHEVRNPLASIRGCVQELGRGMERADDDAKLVEIVCRESDRLDRIIVDFMQFAKLRPPSFAPVDLSTLVRETEALLRHREEAVGVSMEVETPKVALVEADREKLQQVFLNLGVNAIEAMGGTGRLRIGVRECRVAVSQAGWGAGSSGRRLTDTEGFEVSFEDDGPGIPEEVRERVFVPFFTSRADGTGLGLAVAESIIKAHGGRIVVDESPLGGARFAVRLLRLGGGEHLPPPNATPLHPPTRPGVS